MKISEHANYLLNEFGRLQFDYAAYCKPDGESLRNEARNNLETYIAELEAEKCVLEDQQREAKNILIDKKLHIDSLYEEGFKLQQRIAELEGENKKAFDFVKTLRTYCIYAHWDNPDTEGEFNEFDAEICKWLSEFTERER